MNASSLTKLSMDPAVQRGGAVGSHYVRNIRFTRRGPVKDRYPVIPPIVGTEYPVAHRA